MAPPESDLTAEHDKVARLRDELRIGEDDLLRRELLRSPARLAGAAARRRRRRRCRTPTRPTRTSRSAPPCARRRARFTPGANVENAAVSPGPVRRDLGDRRAGQRGRHRDQRRGRGGRADGLLPAVRRLPTAAVGVRPRRHARVSGAPRRPATGDHAGRAAPARVRAGAFMSWREAAQVMERRAGLRPRVGVVLGSGLGAVADSVDDPMVIGYDELPGFPRPGVEGHGGRAVLGQIGGVPVALLQGRAHLYEGGDREALRVPVRALVRRRGRAAGAHQCGGIAALRGGPWPADGDKRPHQPERHEHPRRAQRRRARARASPACATPTTASCATELHSAAAELGIELAEGVYLAVAGPSFETPAEIRAFERLGADAVGMSTVHETVVARHCGLRVAADLGDHQSGRGHRRPAARATSRRSPTPPVRPRTWPRCSCASSSGLRAEPCSCPS